MHYWHSYKFWFAYAVLLLPSLLVFSLPGAIFIDEGTGAVKATGILVSQWMLALMVPWVVIRNAAKYHAARKAGTEQLRRGFPVILAERADREAGGDNRGSR